MQKVKDDKRQEAAIYLFRKMWRFSDGHRPKVVLFIILQILAQSVSLTEPLVFAVFINEIQTHGIGANLPKLLLILSAFILISLTFWAFHGTARILEKRHAFVVQRNYMQYLLDGVFKLNLSWHADRDSGDTIDKVNRAGIGLFQFSTGVFNFIKVIVPLVGTSVILYTFNPYVGIGVFVMIITFFAVLILFDKKLVKQFRHFNVYENKVTAGIFDSISNVNTVLILNIRRAVSEQLKTLMWAPWALWKRNVYLEEAKWFTGDVLFKLILVLPMGFYIMYIHQNNLPVQIGTISAMFLYLSRTSRIFFRLADLYGNTMRRKANVQNAEEIEDAIEQNKKNQQSKQKITNWDVLDIADLNFSYAGSRVKPEDLHLDGVNIKVKKGERIAFIGESGSGKTTFLKVLHGLYDSASAQVSFTQTTKSDLVVETNFTDIDLATMLVPQEPEIFSSTIKENITLGLPTKQGEVEKVLKLARFEDVVKKLPKGLKSVINEKGVNLSGGQKQRLALARALLFAKDKHILLLDESTSSVDPENEAYIYEGIFAEYQDKTILASIHKMNLLKYFDRIVMFKDGAIEDEGTFNELLAKNSKFKKEWEAFVKAR